MPPSPKDWGPYLWKLLHATADCLGVQTHKLLKRDEAIQWSLLLQNIADMMPCAQCQKHYKEWLRAHSPLSFRPLEGPALRDAARLWVWRLHNAVNERNGAPTFPFEDLPDYRITNPQQFRELLDTLTQKIGVQGEPVRIFRKCFIILLKLINKI